MTQEIKLRYGMNPHQSQAKLTFGQGTLPLEVVNGSPGYINLLDALNSWQLVRELKMSLDLPAAASFKHVSPAGAAVAVSLNDALRRSAFSESLELSPLAEAYVRARGADRISSFGDWIALSDVVDLSTALLIRSEVSDGVIAPGYEDKALDILRQKRNGDYTVLQIDASYDPPQVEQRNLFGLTLTQQRNSYVPSSADLNDIVTANRELSENVKRDMLVALIALKYTQSNSVCFAFDGQVIGMGAGQQSRIHCTRLAGSKADNWFLRQHPRVLQLPFWEDCGRTMRDNAIDQFLLPQLTAAEEKAWLQNFSETPQRLSAAEKREWLNSCSGITLGSDAFFPFRDSIDRASQSGVTAVVQPGGSIRDADIVEACDDYGMIMVMTGKRLFHH